MCRFYRSLRLVCIHPAPSVLRAAILIAGSLLAAFATTAAGVCAQTSSAANVVLSISHAGKVEALAFSPDGNQLATAGVDRSVKVWNMRTGTLLRTLLGHIASVRAVAYSPDGRHIASGGNDDTIKLWNAVTGELLLSVQGHTSGVSSLTYSLDNRFIVSASSDSTIKLWRSATLQLVHVFNTHGTEIAEAWLSNDGKLIVSGGSDGSVSLWDTSTGQLVHLLLGHSGRVMAVAVSPDNRYIASGSKDSTIKIWDARNGRLIKTFQDSDGSAPTDEITSVKFSDDGRYLLSASYDNVARLWSTESMTLIQKIGDDVFSRNRMTVFFLTQRPLVSFVPNAPYLLKWGTSGLQRWALDISKNAINTFEGTYPLRSASVEITNALLKPDGAEIAMGGRGVAFINPVTGRVIRGFEQIEFEDLLAWSPNGHMLALASGKTLSVKDSSTHKILRSLSGHRHTVRVAAFSPDDTLIAAGDWGADANDIFLWDLRTGELRLRLEGAHASVASLAFSADGKLLLSGGWDNSIKVWDAASGGLLHRLEVRPGWVSQDSDQLGWVDKAIFAADGRQIVGAARDGRIRLWDTRTGVLLWTSPGHAGGTFALAVTPAGDRLASGGDDGEIKLWDLRRRALATSWPAHSTSVWKVFFSPTADRIYSLGGDDALRIWSTADGAPLGMMFANSKREILTIASAGFFNATSKQWDELSAVKGYEAVGIDQVHQSLFNPDLVREALAGDPNGEVREATKVINLEKVIDSGPAPRVIVTSPGQDGWHSDTDLVTVTAQIEDRNKGVGRIEWRVNGVTAAVAPRPEGNGPVYTMGRELALEPGRNAIEVVAYNGSNLLASMPARTNIRFTEPVDQTKPKLHVLTVGIDKYVDRSSRYRGRILPGWKPLNLAVKDAHAFGAEIKRAGSPMYQQVIVTPVLDEDATLSNLDKVILEIARDVHPRDTFIFFAAAHGYSVNGRFYLIPQDFQGGPNPDLVAARGISQEHLQDWLANRIKARRAIILLDTCESGALVAGHLRSRTEEAASEAGVGRLHEATGRPVLAAAASGQGALEPKQGHGVFTSAVLDAMKHGDTNGNGTIELSELVAYVQANVPRLAADSGDATRGHVVAAGQTARFGSRGEDFAVAKRVQ